MKDHTSMDKLTTVTALLLATFTALRADAQVFQQLDLNGDGKLARDEVADATAFAAADADKNGVVTPDEFRRYMATRQPPSAPKPHKEEIAEQRPGEPPLKKMPDGDASRDAAGRGQLFESIVVPGFTSIQEGMNGVAIADLNNDGLLDLLFASDPDNSGPALSMARYESKVYWNTGLHGAKENHWLRLRFTGVKDAELIGARVTIHDPGTGKLLGMRPIASNHSYKSGGTLDAHFGLGKQTKADVKVTLLNGKTATFPGLKADQFLDLNLKTSQATPVVVEAKR